MTHLRCLLAAFSLLLASTISFAQKEHGFDNTKPSGQPYLTAEETVKRMKVPEGFEVKLFAAEPMLTNPIAFTIDEKGRVWAVECFEYPKRTPPGKMPRDRIVILEDTDGDGKADKRTVFAEGKDFPVRFDLASGIEVGHGGCFLGAPPYLWHLKDTDGDGKADKFDILLKGFGSQDTHETLNSFTWGPDGWLYGLHGIFTDSKVEQVAGAASAPRESGVQMNAAVWRYHPRTRKFELFAEGTSNPWGMDFDSNGNCFICCCVIPHLFHIIPGGIYRRQAGTSFHPYAYGELKEICDHTFHQESGWAHAGLLCLDNPCVPEQFRTSVIFGSIHGCSIKRNVLKRNGSTFTASKAEDFLVSGDKNFRPITLRWGPNGSIYVSDWHDQNPCHQTHPDHWDYERGRIYRIVRKDAQKQPVIDVTKMTLDDLLPVSGKHPNPWQRSIARRVLYESGPDNVGGFAGEEMPVTFLWGLHALGVLKDDAIAVSLLEQNPRPEDADTRAWLIQLMMQRSPFSQSFWTALSAQTRKEQSPAVRLQLASSARFVAADTLPLLHHLLAHKEDADDPLIPFMLWLAYEPKLAANAKTELEWLRANAPGNPLLTQHIIPRAMRRLVATGKAGDLAACIGFLQAVSDVDVQRQALLGLLEAFKQRQFTAPQNWPATYAKLREEPHADLRRMADQLAAHFRDRLAIERAMQTLRDPKASLLQRHDAIAAVALAQPSDGHEALLAVLQEDPSTELRQAAANALSRFQLTEIPARMLAGWKTYPPSLRVECVNTLKSRRLWARQLMEAVGKGEVPRTDLTDQTILAMNSYSDPYLKDLIERVWGRFRATPADLEQLIAKLRGEMDQGHADPAKGKLVFEKNCMQCHKFQGQGHDVGPNLDGAERSIEYLLINVLDPNRVVGQPYFTRVVLRKSGTLVTGLVHAEDGQALTLKRENNALEVIPKTDIEEMKTEPKSLMPEGLGNNMTPQDFRDLVGYLMANPFITEVRVWKDSRVGFGDMPVSQQAEPWKLSGGRVSSTVMKAGVSGRFSLEQSNTAAVGTLEPLWFQYVDAEIRSPVAMQTRLLLGTNGPVAFTVWLNGTRVQEVKDLKKDLPAASDQRSLPVNLQAGANRLVIRYGNSHKEPTLFLHVVDTERKLGYDITDRASR